MSVLDGLDFIPETAARPTAPRADTRDAPGIWAQVTAQANVQADTAEDVQQLRRARAYAPLIDALADLGVERDSLYHRQPGFLGIGPSMRGAYDYERIWREAQRYGIKGLPASQKDFDTQAYRRNGGRDRDQDTLARGQGAASVAAQFVGGMAGSFADPINVYTLPLGGGGKTIAMRILSEGLVNAGVEALQAADNRQAHARLGEEYGLRDAAMDVAMAGAGAAVIRGGMEGGAVGARKLAELVPQDLRLARAFGKAVPDDLRTPEQAAALHVLNRAEEVETSSPFVRTYEGIDAHAATLAKILDDLDQVPERPVRPAASAPAPTRGSGAGLHAGIVGYLRQAGLSEAQARGVAAGIHAESRGNPLARNPTSDALGIGQWLGPRKRELVRRYGPNPTLQQQLDFLVWELRGGDHGGAAVLARSDEAGVLDAYIRQFMRPAAGAETAGDLERGMAALGRAGETPSFADGIAGGEPAMLARSRDLDATRPDILGSRADDGLEDIGPAHPPLQRELFGDEASWRIAQAELDAQRIGSTPAVTRQSVWADARDALMLARQGEVRGALFHRDIGPIDVKWGEAGTGKSDGMGLAKLAAFHPEVLENLPALLEQMEVVSRTANRIRLESPTHKAAVRLDWDGQQQTWLMTAYELRGKGKAASPATEYGLAADDARTGNFSAREAGSNIGAFAEKRNPAEPRLTADTVARAWREGRMPDGFDPAAVERFAADNARAVAEAAERQSLAEAEVQAAAAVPGADLAQFDRPGGEGHTALAESLMHDIAADLASGKLDPAMRLDLDDGRGERSLAEIIDELASDEAAVQALKDCMS